MLGFSPRERKLRAYSYALGLRSLPLKQSGFSLIELLVSLLIFSVAILGLASLQITSLRMAQDAQLVYTASLLAGAISNQLYATQSVNDSEFWVQQVAESLPLGRTKIESKSKGYRVTLSWNSSEDQAQQHAGRRSEYVLDVAR